MQPMQRIPHQRQMGPYRMSPSPFSGHGQMMGPYGGGRPMMGGQRPFQGGSPMMGQMMGRPQSKRGGGGLLAKILGGNKNQRGTFSGIQAGTQTASRGGGGIGSILQNLSNPEGLSGIINNTQQVLKTAQSIGPMIQQYGPIVKNLPAMWRLYKGLKDAPAENTDTDSQSTAPVMAENELPEEESEEIKERPRKKLSNQMETSPQKQKSNNHGGSVPRLYI